MGSSLAAVRSLCTSTTDPLLLRTRACAMAPRRKEQEEKLRVLLAEVEAELRSRGASPEVRWLSFQYWIGPRQPQSECGCQQLTQDVRPTATNTNSDDTATAQVQKYVADVLRQHYTRYNDYMSKEADMRRELQRYVTTLEVGPGNRVYSKVLQQGICVWAAASNARSLAAGASAAHAEGWQARI